MHCKYTVVLWKFQILLLFTYTTHISTKCRIFANLKFYYIDKLKDTFFFFIFILNIARAFINVLVFFNICYNILNECICMYWYYYKCGIMFKIVVTKL